jgi:hypothetical protein
MRSKMLPMVIIFVFSAFSAAMAQEDWKTKNFDRWDKKDVETILNNSSWVKNQEVRLQYEGILGSVAGATIADATTIPNAVTTATTGQVQPAVDFTFTLRLRSSMAIRLALVRKMQLENNPEKMSNAEFEIYKKKLVGLYECPACANNYVLTLTSSSKENKNFDAVYASFSRAQLNDIKRYIYLQNERGEKRELVNFVAPKAPGEEAVFFFPRLDEKGNPLFTTKSKQLIFNVTNNQVNTVTNFKVEIAPLIVGGDKVDF